jgi:hypothetical protein
VSAILIYIHLSLFMTPVLVGLFWRRFHVPVLLFLCGTSITMVFAFAEGSRSLIFFPVVFFAVGVWLTLNFRIRLFTALLGAVLAIPVFYVSALIVNVRDEVRGGPEAVMERAQRIATAVFQAKTETSIKEEFLRGLNRMIMWSNVVALASTPEDVPYRGFENFGDEVRLLNRTTFFGGASESDQERYDLELGAGAAKVYGFGISLGGTVPFPVLADGWSRAGFAGVVLFSVILCCLWGFAEHFVRRWHAVKPHLAVALIGILASSAYDRMGIYGFVYNVRYLVMLMALWCLVFYVSMKLTGVLVRGSLGGKR